MGRRLRASRTPGDPPQVELFERLHGGFEEARKKRLAGDGAGYLLALADVDRQLRGAEGEAVVETAADGSLQDAVERARYGGQVPPAEELETLRRSIERRLEELRPDTREDERASLKLKESAS